MDFLFILWIFLISIGINLIFFVIAFLWKTDIFTDITYSLTFITLSVVLIIWKQNFSINQMLLFGIEVLWAVRLGAYLLSRILKTKVDHRFDNMRNSFWKFGAFWLLQGISVAVISLPINFALVLNSSYFNGLEYLTPILLISLMALIFETIADYQKSKYYNKKDHKFMKTGLWKISRHPNYFGEIIFWWFIGIFVCATICIQNNKQPLEETILSSIMVLIPALYINFLLLKLSGLPLLERSANKKWSSNKEYLEYVKTTSMIVPWIGKKGLYKNKK